MAVQLRTFNRKSALLWTHTYTCAHIRTHTCMHMHTYINPSIHTYMSFAQRRAKGWASELVPGEVLSRFKQVYAPAHKDHSTAHRLLDAAACFSTHYRWDASAHCRVLVHNDSFQMRMVYFVESSERCVEADDNTSMRM